MEIYQPYFLQLSRNEQKAMLEALIFASDDVLTLDLMYLNLAADIPATKEVTEPKENPDQGTIITEEPTNKKSYYLNFFRELISEINSELIETNRPYQIMNIAGGYQFFTRAEYGELIRHLLKTKTKRRLSQASLETLAIVAYRQPITKPEIEQIRGVNSGDIVNSLIEKNLVEITGRKEGLGRPLLYSTTTEFLKTFGLVAIEDLPKLRELSEIAQEEPPNENIIEISVNETINEKLQSIKEHIQSELIELEEQADEVEEISENDITV